jgi:Ca-activated chloride channel family protein
VDAGGIPPRKAARIAAARGVRIHTVTVGEPAKSEESSALASLREIAASTGGTALAAASRDELGAATRKLDEIEALDVQAATYRPRRPLYYWPLGAGTLLAVAFYLASGAGVLVREAAS